MSRTLTGVSSAGSFPGQPAIFFFQNSRIWTPPRKGRGRWIIIGPGGSGAAVHSNFGPIGKATGGGAGARAEKVVDVDPATTWTVAIGAGGQPVYTPGGVGSVLNGEDGGDTSVTNGVLTVTAGGGRGGRGTMTASPVPAVDGGTAVGGDVNLQGGRSGAITSDSPARQATGGGAVDLGYGAFRGGDITLGSPTFAFPLATGGAGVVADGGDNFENGGGLSPWRLAGLPFPILSTVHLFSQMSAPDGKGNGGNGNSFSTGTSGGLFAGGGGAIRDGLGASGGHGGFPGGGGGGAVGTHNGTAGAGGDGFVYFEYLS